MELDELKAEKKTLSKKLKIAEGCVKEYKTFSMLDFSTIEDEIRNSIEVLEYPHVVAKQTQENSYSVYRIDENFTVTVEDMKTDKKEEAYMLSEVLPKSEKDIALSVNDSVLDIDMDGISVMNEPKDYDTSLGAAICEEILVEDSMGATAGVASEENIVEEYTVDWADDKDSYEMYKKLTPLEKAQTYGFGELKSYDTIRSIVQMKFLDMGHIADVNELVEETDLLNQGMCELVVKNKTEEVLDEIKRRGIAFDGCSVAEKATMLQFRPDNNSYNIQRYSAACRACGVDTSDEDKAFEDY